MQLSPVASVPVSPIAAAAAPTFAAPVAAPATPQRAAWPASPSVPATDAVQGSALISTPIVDFPGVGAGDRYAIVKGSTAGKFGGVKGDAQILRFDPDFASFQVKAGKFGFNVDVRVDIERLDAERVLIRSTGKGLVPDAEAIARIVQSRENYAEFVNEANAAERTIIQRDAAGTILIDTVVPSVGDAHLILERR